MENVNKCHYFLIPFFPAFHQTIRIFCSCIGLPQILAENSKAENSKYNWQGFSPQIYLINGVVFNCLNKMFKNFYY